MTFINDLDGGLINYVFKFADDTKLLETVVSLTDRYSPAQSTATFGLVRHMAVTIQYLQVPGFTSGSMFQGFLILYKWIILESVSGVRDLGVQFTADLKQSRQCQLAYSTASRVLVMIARTISYKSLEFMLRLHKSLVRPYLKFCTSVSSLYYYNKDKQLLERVQHRFTRMISGLRRLPYHKRLEALDLWSLEERRNRAD